MTIHKLCFDEIEENKYHLIAIHTSLEDYRLAYFLNQHLSINLSKCKNEIQIQMKNGETQFGRFVYDDEQKGIQWNLIHNKNEITLKNKTESLGLFAQTPNSFTSKAYLLPEFKKADYLLKIEMADNSLEIPALKTTLNTIERISTVYSIDIENTKSKNNLIF